ncbi:pectin lyase-like protein [Violaceomyces palustris]|uniref:Pectin lyase-like protein n=1 Tax=Violaceomyces palustris TaxID=1673888 RepID=A0ACD0NNX1_9BASI|nr:pectin lyase-like protein [Violaceomyces palustris]
MASSATTYSECQRPKPQGQQLESCPAGTVYVSQTDPQSTFGTIQAAILSLPLDMSSQTILIGPGNYHEVVNVTRKGPTTLLGITSDPDDYRRNQVHVWNSSYINQATQVAGQDNADASVLTVSPNRAASLVGSGPSGAPLQPEFGCVDFRTYNIDFANRATVNGVEKKDGQTGPSAALSVSYANASFYQSTFYSYQDTVYIGRNASAFFYSGEVRGWTDYLYGFGRAWFEATKLANRGNGGGLTAWKGSTLFYGNDTNGVYMNRGSVVRADDAPANLDLTHSCALGRPWNNMSVSIMKNMYQSDIVLPQGYIIWSKSDPRIVPGLTNFAEYNSMGPGWNATARNQSIETILTQDQANLYTVETVFGGIPSWIDLGTASLA